MSIRCEILIPSSGVIELYDNVPISLTYQIADIKDPQKRHADYSKTITVPGTANNNKMFQMIFDIGIDRRFDPNKKASAIMVIDSSTVMKGYIRLKRIKVNDKKIDYEIEMTGRTADLFTALGDTKIADLSWSDLNHTYTQANQIASWSAPVGHNYVYPFIDYGYSLDEFTYDVNHFFPAVYFKEILDRAFSFAGFQYSSTFLTSTIFKRLILPFNSNKMRLTTAQMDNRKFRAGMSGVDPTFTISDSTQWAASDVVFNDDTTSPNQDLGGVFNTTTGIWTCNATGYYSIGGYVLAQKDSDASTSAYVNFDIVNTTAAGSPVIASSINELFDTASQLSALNVSQQVKYINSGDQIKMRIWGLNNQAAGTVITIRNTSFFYAIPEAEIKEGGDVTMANIFPQDLKCADFIASIIKAFNLYFEYDKDIPNKIYIEPRNDYYNSTIQDWTQLRDLSRDLEIVPMGALDARQYIFTYKEDKDFLNDLYKKNTGEVYGQKKITVDNDFLTSVKKEELIFSPTPLDSSSAMAQGVPVVSPNDRYFAKIVSLDSKGAATPTSSNPRMLYYGGVKQCKPWNYTSTLSGTSGATNYPYAGHLDDPLTPTLDLSFGVPKIVYYDPPISVTYTNNNLYNKYWKQAITEITDKNSSLVVGYFHLKPKDISIVDFRHIYRFDFQNFRLNKIYDFDPINDTLTKCEFIKIKNGIPFTSASGTMDGASDTEAGDDALPFILSRLRAGNNSASANGFIGNAFISGTNNVVSRSAKGVIVSGNNNSVGDNAENISILNSSGCVVQGGLRNVQILNSSGVTVRDSNITYERNIVTSNATGGIKQISANNTIDNGEKTVLVDASGGGVAYQLPNAALYPGRPITIKKIDSTGNTVTIEGFAAGQTIDGSSTKSISTQWNYYTVKSNGSAWFIVANN